MRPQAASVMVVTIVSGAEVGGIDEKKHPVITAAANSGKGNKTARENGNSSRTRSNELKIGGNK